MTEEELKKAVEEHLKSLGSGIVTQANVLKSHTFHTNWLYVLIGFVVLALVLYIVIDRHYSYEMSVKDAETAEKLAKATEKTAAAQEQARQEANRILSNQIAEGQRMVAQQISQQNAIIKKSLERDSRVDAQIGQVLQPGQTADVVKKYTRDNLKMEPTIEAGGLLFKIDDVQTLVAIKLDRDRLAEKVKDDNDRIISQEKSLAILNENLAKSTKAIEAANEMAASYQRVIDEKDKTIAEYKKAATKTKWQKVWDVAQKTAFIGLGIAIGSLIH